MSNLCKDIGELNYKQPAGTIFTEWRSAGLYGMVNNNNISNYPLVSANNLVNKEIVLNNNNNIRNNYQNHTSTFYDSLNTFNELSLNNTNEVCTLGEINK